MGVLAHATASVAPKHTTALAKPWRIVPLPPPNGVRLARRSGRAPYRSPASSASGTHSRPLNWIDPAGGTTFRFTRPDVRSRPVAPSYAPVPPVTSSRELGRTHVGSGSGSSRISSDVMIVPRRLVIV